MATTGKAVIRKITTNGPYGYIYEQGNLANGDLLGLQGEQGKTLAQAVDAVKALIALLPGNITSVMIIGKSDG